MARSLKVTAELGAVIDDLRHSTHNVSALHRALKARGVQINRRTLDRYLAGRGAYSAPGARPRPVATPARPAPQDAASAAAAAGQAALEADGDLAELERAAAAVKAAMVLWESQLAHEPSAVRAYRALADTFGGLIARCAELRPKADVEREALLERGSDERDELIARARIAARKIEDTRGQLARALHLLNNGHGATDG